MTQQADEFAKGTWVTYRPEIRVLDCTVRDGGLINNHQFDDSLVRAVYETCVAAGIDYMELGYKGSKKIFARDQFGDWKFCDEDHLRRIVDDNPTALRLSAMADAERTDYHTDILPKEQSVLDLIRVATYIHQVPTALDIIRDAHHNGYETTVNLMAVSAVPEREMLEALEQFAASPVDTVYLVDSFGTFYTLKVKELTLKYLEALEGTGKEVGIHMHNNQQLAYANTIEGVVWGANRLDATINGMGRGAGNCPLELLIAFLKNPKFHLRPILECIQRHFMPLLKEGRMEWGYMIPYMITGMLNQHPRPAMKLRAGDSPDNYVEFYDQMIEEE